MRNGKDPFLVAEVVTLRTFNFGMKSHDLLVLGIILTIIGTLLTLQPIFYLCRLRKQGANRYDYDYKYRHGDGMRRHVDEFEEEDEEGPNSEVGNGEFI